jgi:hypothetical protein
MMNLLAKDNLLIFAREHILNRKGNEERKLIAEILNYYNPEFYKQNQLVLDKTRDLDEITSNFEMEKE